MCRPFHLKQSGGPREIQPQSTVATLLSRCRQENFMKLYRLISLFMAVLITVSLVRFLADQKTGDPREEHAVSVTIEPPE